MKGKIEIGGREIAGLRRGGDRSFAIAERRERSAQMAIALGPVRTMIDQPLISAGRLLREAAIAEQPRAEMRDGIIVGRDGEGPEPAFERIFATASVEQRLGEPTLELRRLRVALVAAQHVQTVIERTALQCAGETRTIDR
jgi:hypothetical protein